MTPFGKRQAIIVIHGIGEQHPIVTLRGFVESVAKYLKFVKEEAREEEPVFWDKPDPSSGNFETRKMTMRGGRNHPTTDFYEFYWAQHMRDTKFSHIKDWLERVVFRSPASVSRRLLKVYYFLWLLIVIFLSICIYGIATEGLSAFVKNISAVTSGLVVGAILAWLSHFLFFYLGDAARYLDPSPGNIGERQAIRTEGITLLKNLHQSGKYERIVIVSHSLGTCIGYDLIKLLWCEYNTKFDDTKFATLVANDHNDILGDVEASEKAKELLSKDEGLQLFREAQQKSYNYLKATGNPWLITDLVTIGSPLTHAGHLFAQENGLFKKLIDQREYPTCPPYIQPPDKTNILESTITAVGDKTLRYFNHSSPFAVTRWTNIFYSSDFVGGPLQQAFGSGIKDIEIERKNGFFAYPGGHTEYWDYNNKGNILGEIWGVLENK